MCVFCVFPAFDSDGHGPLPNTIDDIWYLPSLSILSCMLLRAIHTCIWSRFPSLHLFNLRQRLRELQFHCLSAPSPLSQNAYQVDAHVYAQDGKKRAEYHDLWDVGFRSVVGLGSVL